MLKSIDFLKNCFFFLTSFQEGELCKDGSIRVHLYVGGFMRERKKRQLKECHMLIQD